MSWINSNSKNGKCRCCGDDCITWVCWGCYKKLREFERKWTEKNGLTIHGFWDDEYRELILELYLVSIDKTRKEVVLFT